MTTLRLSASLLLAVFLVACASDGDFKEAGVPGTPASVAITLPRTPTPANTPDDVVRPSTTPTIASLAVSDGTSLPATPQPTTGGGVVPALLDNVNPDLEEELTFRAMFDVGDLEVAGTFGFMMVLADSQEAFTTAQLLVFGQVLDSSREFNMIQIGDGFVLLQDQVAPVTLELSMYSGASGWVRLTDAEKEDLITGALNELSVFYPGVDLRYRVTSTTSDPVLGEGTYVHEGQSTTVDFK